MWSPKLLEQGTEDASMHGNRAYVGPFCSAKNDLEVIKVLANNIQGKDQGVYLAYTARSELIEGLFGETATPSSF